MSVAHLGALSQVCKEAKVLCLFVVCSWAYEAKAKAVEDGERERRTREEAKGMEQKGKEKLTGMPRLHQQGGASASSAVAPSYQHGAAIVPPAAAPRSATGAVLPRRVVPQSVVDIDDVD